MQLARNISRDERMTRFGVGALMVACYAFGAIGPWGLIGLAFVVTSWMNFCPFYRMIGIKTCDDC